jgi:hypothetical protein
LDIDLAVLIAGYKKFREEQRTRKRPKKSAAWRIMNLKKHMIKHPTSLKTSCIANSNKRRQNMNPMKSTLMIALVTGMILLAVLGFNLTRVHAHGHGGGGHGGGGGGGHHHGEHAHEHYSGGEHQHDDGSGNDSHYHHSHDDSGDHGHSCRPIQGSETAAGAGQGDPSNEECQNHDGDWEPSRGD